LIADCRLQIAGHSHLCRYTIPTLKKGEEK